MNTVIRVDSSERIGSGHLMRCLTLAGHMRREGKTVHFICRDLVGNLSRIVTAQGFALHLLPPHEHDAALTDYAVWLTAPQEVDAQESAEIIRELQPVERLVIDHYALDAAWERRMRPLVQEIFVIDDLANRPHDCDILLDQNFYRDMERRYDGLVPETCKLLLGPKHALLRREFYEARKTLRRRDGKLCRILVFYGGSDQTRETEKAIAALLQLALPGVEADVVVGGGNARQEHIRSLCEAHEFLHYHLQVSNMAELMASADLALGAGGTTTWERCFLGLPAIVTAIAENQFEICRDCAEAGLIYYLGKWDEVMQEDIAAGIKMFSAPEKLHSFQQACSLKE
ncbi:pseudaminic acid biosynthesis-associated protein PseG [Selenomonas sp. oral taxon 137 str. F0430]|uniref:UDP-2,4-diacetamido-2,4, 6-trideoxy-beta-L-altropyranose hydrolase n=1 Tax=Selenomonas sp. oral taxon 137 TaxID=712531 RepID=UPI0001EB2278|nr:UDP-2,4-diacetamido-2,4,6-trideoxy-beta-L-altropyranose hydrolase [Selenomonas sp. oral taxon 137]EFR41464.1 pseudaminic acid biosynthesis-associated protein PseG [Selenomonas sp. oral taxon 137 str. F0430]